MNKNVFISIIIPIFNGEKYILKCLKHIANQTYKDYEVVFIDDKSQDRSEEIIKDFMSQNSYISYKYIKSQENHGVAYSKKMGLKHAEGVFVMFHDQDDWMDINCLQVLAEYALKTGADRITGAYREVDCNNRILRKVDYSNNFSKWFATALHGVIYRRSVFINNNIIIPENTLMEDAHINCVYAKYAKKCVYVNETIFNYLIREDSTSGAKSQTENYNAIRLFESALNCFVPLYEEVEDVEDKADIEYMAIKQYYYYLLHNNRYSSYDKIIKDYEILNDMILKNFSQYMHNKRITWFKNNGDRKSGKKRTFIIATIERIKLMKLFLWIYQRISKIKYLN